MLRAVCVTCGKERSSFSGKPTCECGGILEPRVDFRYREGPYTANYPYLEEVVSLGEVVTPLIGEGELKFKLDYFQPTFSYKDRGSMALLSSLKSHLPSGAEINEDSSGNAGASISAYGRAAGFRVNIFVPGSTKLGKVNQIKAYGANVRLVNGSRKEVSDAAKSHPGYYASHVLNPEFRDGMRQLAYEIFQQLDHRVPDRVFVPVSAGTLLLGLVSGFEHLKASGESAKVPEIVGVQSEAVCPVCARINGFHYDKNNGKTSVADALVSRESPLLDLMVKSLEKSGRCVTVREDEIISAREDLAGRGIYVEYSSATVLAAYRKDHFEGENVMVLTGNGLKTP